MTLMKELAPVNTARLVHLEFGQFVKSSVKNLRLLRDGTLVTDETAKKYIHETDAKSTGFDKVLVRVMKNAETANIVLCDIRRDHAVTTAQRQLSVFEFTDNADEHTAYVRLTTLFGAYKGIQSWNFEKESNGIDNLVADLLGEKYVSFTTLLGMVKYAQQMQTENDAFKTIFNSRTQEVISEDVFDAKELRRELKDSYERLANYVVTMAEARDNEEFNESLKALNTVRTYYADLLAKRKPATKDEPQAPIPPMP